jgi:hypothetical protein
VGVVESADPDQWGFDPPQLRIALGEGVTWENSGLELHTVVADDGSFDSGLLDTGQHFHVDFPEPGSYAYHCQLYPAMRGLLVVEDRPPRLYFAQTGFAVDDPAFADYFRTRGGVRSFGYPVSRPFRLQGARVQVFQRFALRQGADGAVHTLNLLDAGVMPFTRFNGLAVPAADPSVTAAAPSPFAADYGRLAADFVRANAPDTWDGLPVRFGATFFGSVACPDAFPRGDCQASLLPLLALELWGLPTSRPAHDPANGGFVYLRFERGIMQFDARSGATQGLLLGDLFKSLLTAHGLPADVAAQAQGSPYLAQYDPTRPRSLARPEAVPDSDLADAFTPQSP